MPVSARPSPLLSRPRTRSVISGGGGFLAVVIGSGAYYWQAAQTLQSEVHDDLRRTATVVAQSIDGDAHRTFTDPAQETTPAYAQAIRLMERILRLPRADGQGQEYKNVYTAILAPDGPRSILDATPPGGADRDGVDDKSHIMQAYPEATAALRRAFATGAAQADAEPYRDQWGVFVSGYAPFRDS
eukprot:gene37564-60888_t